MWEREQVRKGKRVPLLVDYDDVEQVVAYVQQAFALGYDLNYR